MGFISFRTLNEDLKIALSIGAIPESDLPHVQARVKQTYAEAKKETRVLCTIFLLLIFAIIAYIIYDDVKSSVEVSIIIETVLWLGIPLAALVPACAFLNSGLMKFQYNHALKKGYPEQADLYKL